MNFQCINAAAIRPQAWRNGGGQTRELLLWPPSASPEDWQLRITLAEVTQDGPFSPYPGVRRRFVVVEGCGLSLRWPTDRHWKDLLPGHPPVSFDGGQPPDCRLLRGAPSDPNHHSTDLNLMTRALQGQMSDMQPGVAMRFTCAQRGFFAAQAGRWWWGDSTPQEDSFTQEVAAHTLVWAGDHLTATAPETWHFEPLHTCAPGQPIGWWLGVAPH